MTELKRCPHCGGKPMLVHEFYSFVVECVDCGASPMFFCDTVKEAAYFWNKFAAANKEENIMTIEKIYLGLSLGFNSSACVYSNKRGVLAAISQERLNGQKNTKELPLDAAVKCCELAGIRNVHKIFISHYENIEDTYFEKYGEKYQVIAEDWQTAIVNYLFINNIDVDDQEIERINHHAAHAASTFAFYGAPEYGDIVITSDGFGDGFSGTIVRNGDIRPLSVVRLKNSVGLVYQFVTGALGYKEHQHEGKITGLAAFGEPKYLADFNALYNVSENENFIDFKSQNYDVEHEESAIIDFDDFLKLKKAIYSLVNDLLVEGAEPKDIAATVQEWSEQITCNWIKRIVNEHENNCYLAGGLFANVKINQRIKDLGIFENVYVCPAMGDEGTAVGAAIYYEEDIKKISPNQCGSVADEAIVYQLFNKLCTNKNAYKIHNIEDDQLLSSWIAKQLASDRIVCLVKGKMEFGPRALCHRSILYNCNTKETNTWLNDKLGRTEFMPFAPVTREEVADDLFKNLDGGRDSAKHMTMTFDCTDEFVRDYPAACHVDNTARPQIVSRTEDPFIWSVLERYQEFTGKKALINTSFNLHNNPIIESTEVAISSWLTSDTDILVIGNTVIEKA